MSFRVTLLRSPLMARLLAPRDLRKAGGSLRVVVRVGAPVTDAIETMPPALLNELAWQARASLGDALPEVKP